SVHNGDNGSAINAGITFLYGGSCDKFNNYYFPELTGNTIRRISASGIITTVAGNGISGYLGDNSSATNAEFHSPSALTVDTIGNIFISDQMNHRIRKIDIYTGIITTICGNGNIGNTGDNGPASAALINNVLGLCFDKFGNLYLADYYDNRVRKINVLGIITTVAGNGIGGYSSDGGLADTTRLNGPMGICTDTIGNLYIADNGNSRIRKVDALSGIITTVAGIGIEGNGGDNNLAINATIVAAYVAIDLQNNLYVCQFHAGPYGDKIRKIDNAGIITTVVGNGTSGFMGDNGLAILSELNNPCGISFDQCGNLYIGDDYNHRIRKVWFNYSIGVYPAAQVCPGTQVTLTAYAPDSCTPVSYQWIKNGVNVGTNNDSFTYIPVNGDVITCQFTCGASGTHTSCNTVHMVVNAAPIAVITVSPNDTVASGTSVAFTCTVNGGTSITYQWVLNGVNVGTNSNTYTYTPSSGDSVYCIIKATYCGSTNVSDSSNVIYMHLLGDGVSSVPFSVSDVQVYPNPTEGLLYVANLKEKVQYRILNIIGATLQQGTLQSNNSKLSLQAYPTGMYLLELTDTEGQKKVMRIEKR
ncbi:MAG: T9SS type A sorting domain-containing protein, partial [Bacteroidota bacterium]